MSPTPRRKTVTPVRRAPQLATVDEARAYANSKGTSALLCRTNGHNWEMRQINDNARYGYMQVVQGCYSCGADRIQEMSRKTGRVYAARITYPEGYLTKDIGRIVGDAKDIVRLTLVKRYSDLTRRSTDEPKSAATRAAASLA